MIVIIDLMVYMFIGISWMLFQVEEMSHVYRKLFPLVSLEMLPER